jgi:tetratricopeptide (TPR) repeat protein
MINAWVVRLGFFVVTLAVAESLMLSAASGFFSEAQSYYAKELTETQKIANARLAATRAVRLNARNPYGLFHLATTDFIEGSRSEAISVFNQAEPLMPHISNLLRLRAQALFQEGDFEKAANDLDLYFTVNPESKVTQGYLHRIAGEAHLQLQRYSTAAAHFRDAAMQKDSRDDALRLDLPCRVFSLQYEAGLYSYLALKSLGLEKRLNPADILRNAVQVHQEAAVATFLDLLRRTGHSGPTWEKVEAMALAKSGQIDVAVTLLRTLYVNHPADAELLLMTGDLLYQKKDIPGASALYDQYLQKVPDSPLREELQRRKATLQ